MTVNSIAHKVLTDDNIAIWEIASVSLVMVRPQQKNNCNNSCYAYISTAGLFYNTSDFIGRRQQLAELLRHGSNVNLCGRIGVTWPGMYSPMSLIWR